MEKIAVRYAGLIRYAEAWKKQQDIFRDLLEAKETTGRQNEDVPAAGRHSPEQVLLLCEHPHVYTLGKSGNASNLLVDEVFLQKIGAEFFRIDRGGDVTYHGIGQLVGYPILDLERLGMGLKTYIDALEESVIDTVTGYGIEAGRQEGATGVWIEPGTARARKICAIGVKASRFVTMHGFALNVTTDLDYFSWINPCGFRDKGVTSIERETGLRPSLEEVAERYAVHFARHFDRETGKVLSFPG